MEKIFDFGVDMMLPMMGSTVFKAIDTLQKQQNPPYSDGVFFIEIRKEIVKTEGLLFNKLMPAVLDPVLTNLFRADVFYANPDCTKYSAKKVDDGYKLFSECIAKNYPGYAIDEKGLIVN